MTIAAQPRETIQETPFYVAATGIGNRRQCSLKYGDTFLVMDNYGDVGAAEGGPDGTLSQRHAISVPPRAHRQ